MERSTTQEEPKAPALSTTEGPSSTPAAAPLSLAEPNATIPTISTSPIDTTPIPTSTARTTELKLAPIEPTPVEAPLTLSVAPAADTPDAKPPSLEITEEEAKKKAASTVIEGKAPASTPAAVINDEEKGTELEADPTKTPTQANDDPKDDKLGPTWFDALLLAVKSLTALSIATSVEIYKNREAILEYIKNSPKNTAASVKDLTKALVNAKLIDPKIEKAFGELLEKFKKIETELRAGPTDEQKSALEGNKSAQIIKDFLTETKPDALPEIPAHNTIQPTADSTAQLPEPKPAIPTPSPDNTHTVPETEAEKKARETAEDAAKKPAIEPVLEAPTPTPSPQTPTLTSVQEKLANQAASGNQLPVSTPPGEEITPQNDADAKKLPTLKSSVPVPTTPALSSPTPDPASLLHAATAAGKTPALTATTETPKPRGP